MARSIDVEALQKRAAASLARLPWWGELKVRASDARDVAAWMKLAAAELPSDLVRNRDFGVAHEAVAAWAAASTLRDRAIALIGDPRVRAVAGDEQTLRHLVEHPNEAMKLLVEHSSRFPAAYRGDSPLAQALAVASEAVTFHETHASSDLGPDMAAAAVVHRGEQQTPAPGPSSAASPKPNGGRLSPSPASSGKEPRTYAELIAAEKLTPSQWGRLKDLAAQRHHDPDEDPGFAGAEWPEGTAPARPARGPGAESNADWAAAVARYERSHPVELEDDPHAELPPSYYGEEEGENK